MTIRTTLPCADANRRLNLLEACVEDAPSGTYEAAKEIRQIIGETADEFMQQIRRMGLETPNCDQIREVEAVLYNYVREANPTFVASAEGFGEAMLEGSNRDRLIHAAERDRDFTLGLGNIGVHEPTVDEVIASLKEEVR